MIEVTDSAVQWLKADRARNQVPETHGIRIYAAEGASGIAIRYAVGPEADEQSFEQGGVRFFSTPAIDRFFEARYIDAREDDSGKGLLIRRRASAAKAPDPASAKSEVTGARH